MQYDELRKINILVGEWLQISKLVILINDAISEYNDLQSEIRSQFNLIQDEIFDRFIYDEEYEDDIDLETLEKFSEILRNLENVNEDCYDIYLFTRCFHNLHRNEFKRIWDYLLNLTQNEYYYKAKFIFITQSFDFVYSFPDEILSNLQIIKADKLGPRIFVDYELQDIRNTVRHIEIR